MLILAILFTLVLAAAFAVVPARLGRRKPTRADGCCALLPAVLVWLWARSKYGAKRPKAGAKK